jgi:hypothetical protein
VARVWKETKSQVRFDEPIPMDVEAAPGLAEDGYAGLARAIEAEIRSRLQVRVQVTVLPPGAIPRSAYKNSLLAVREPKEMTND